MSTPRWSRHLHPSRDAVLDAHPAWCAFAGEPGNGCGNHLSPIDDTPATAGRVEPGDLHDDFIAFPFVSSAAALTEDGQRAVLLVVKNTDGKWAQAFLTPYEARQLAQRVDLAADTAERD